jgi:hypothetical protein
MKNKTALPMRGSGASKVVFSLKERDVLSRVYADKAAGSQQQPARAESVTMLRVHYRAPESLPSHQRDFPPRRPSGEIAGAEGSLQLAFMVACYVVALIAGIVLLGQLAASNLPNTTGAEVVVGR